MGVFDFFKKKEAEPHYDVTNIRVTDIEEAYVLDYDLESWIVKKMFEYDWGDNFFTREFLIFNGKENRYLHIEEDDELEISLTKKISVRELDASIPSSIKKKDKPPKEIHWEGEVYYRDSKDVGYYREVINEDWSELINWLYLDKTEEKLINITQYGEDKFEASIGDYIEERKISNILPQK